MSDPASSPGPARRSPLPAELDSLAAARPTRFATSHAAAPVPDGFIARLAEVCAAIDTTGAGRVEAGRDWWPLSTVWAVEGTVPALPDVVARPADASQVAAVLALCNQDRIPLTPFAGRSGVCGGSIPVHGGVSLDLTDLAGIVDVDDSSLQVDVRSGTFGDTFEADLQRDHSLTLGHWPQSISLSTVGGWIACRGAGQYSTRYGKIEDMVVGLEVALADGRVIRTGGRAPRSATGPDLGQLFVGSEGTLGVITEARLRVHPRPPYERRSVFHFGDFVTGLDACRRILRRGATPAVLRLYDPAESTRNFEVEDSALLIVVDEGDEVIVDASMSVAAEEATILGAVPGDVALAGRWLDHRNQIPSVESLVRAGIVVDTVEISGPWGTLAAVYENAVAGLQAVPETLAASAHQSHAYPDGGCLYFTFAGRPESQSDRDASERYYLRALDIIMAATRAGGGAISHHHGIGIARGPYMRTYLGESFDVLTAVKDALDPRGILNPGKLGLGSAFGEPWEGLVQP